MPTVPPFVSQAISVLVRATIVWLAGKFGASISEDRALEITAQVVPVVLMVGWSLYAKYRGQQKLLFALASPRVMTEHEVEVKVSNPALLTPSVNTPKDEVPK
jgi:uncharacterized protein (DUF697 family)